jgi:hypothetical protein
VGSFSEFVLVCVFSGFKLVGAVGDGIFFHDNRHFGFDVDFF